MAQAIDISLQLVVLILDRLDKRELRAAAVEVVLGTVNLEVMVAVEVVREKADAAFERHQETAEGHVADFRLVEEVAGVQRRVADAPDPVEREFREAGFRLVEFQLVGLLFGLLLSLLLPYFAVFSSLFFNLSKTINLIRLNQHKYSWGKE